MESAILSRGTLMVEDLGVGYGRLRGDRTYAQYELDDMSKRYSEYATSILSREFSSTAKALHDFNHTHAEGFFAQRKKKKSFKEASGRFLASDVNRGYLPREVPESAIFYSEERGDFERALGRISTSALVDKHELMSLDLLYLVHSNSSETTGGIQQLLTDGYLLEMVGDEIAKRVFDGDQEAMNFIESRPDSTWELAKKEKEIFGVNKIRPEKLLTADEVMEYTQLDEDELVVYVWGEMLEGKPPPDSNPVPFGWEKPKRRKISLEAISEEDKSNVRRLLYPAWLVMDLKKNA